MPRRRKGRSPAEPVAEIVDPHGLLALISPHLAWLEARDYNLDGLWTRRTDLEEFSTWCSARGVDRPPDLNRTVIDLYQRHISQRPKANGDLLSPQTQGKKLLAIVKYCRWLVRERMILYDPSAELELPRRQIRLPQAVLTIEEVERILAVPEVSTSLGLRNRAILETLYATGIRRAELLHLKLEDLQLQRGVISIRQGKGKKDRFVPAGERATAWIVKYLRDSRPQLETIRSGRAVFLSARGVVIAPHYLTELVSTLTHRAGVDKPGGCHLLRHTAATLMLEGGADIRFVQELLGHADLKTTQVYTRVSIHKLKSVHSATHPGAKLERSDRGPEPPTREELLEAIEEKTDEERINEPKTSGLRILLDELPPGAPS